MLPHGTRSAARPRVTTEPRCTTRADDGQDQADRAGAAARRRGGRRGGGASSAVDAAAAGHRAGSARRGGAGSRPTAGGGRLGDAGGPPGGLLAGEGRASPGRRAATAAKNSRSLQLGQCGVGHAAPRSGAVRVRRSCADARRARRTPPRRPPAPVRASPATSTTVRPSAGLAACRGGPHPEPAAADEQRQAQAERPSRSPATSATSLPGSWVTWKVAHSVVSTNVRLPPPGSSQVSPGGSSDGRRAVADRPQPRAVLELRRPTAARRCRGRGRRGSRARSAPGFSGAG